VSPSERAARSLGRWLGRFAGRARVATRRLTVALWGDDEQRGLLGGRTADSGLVPARLDGLVSLRRGLDLLAAVALVAAGATLAGLLPGETVRTVAAVARPALGVLGLATVAAVLLTWGHESPTGTHESPTTRDTDAAEPERHEWSESLSPTPPERIPAGDGLQRGAWVTLAAGEDDRVAAATTTGRYGEGSAHETLADAAVAAVAADDDVDETVAAARVADGSWTDDPRAAAYLAEGPTPTVPPLVRLRDWLSGERHSRRVRATVREIEHRADVDTRTASDVSDAATTAISEEFGRGGGPGGRDPTADDAATRDSYSADDGPRTTDEGVEERDESEDGIEERDESEDREERDPARLVVSHGVFSWEVDR
jgi:hypothetical protein